MKVDKGFCCFACGTKGDVITFVADFFHLTPLEAAKKLAEDFRIPIFTDSSKKRNTGKEKEKPKRTLYQTEKKFEEWERESIRILSDYLHLLKEWERNFRPESMEKIDERYVEAVQNREKVEFQLDTLLWGTEDEKEAVIHDLGKGVEDIERRVREYRRNQGTVNHNRQRSCEAVH